MAVLAGVLLIGGLSYWVLHGSWQSVAPQSLTPPASTAAAAPPPGPASTAAARRPHPCQGHRHRRQRRHRPHPCQGHRHRRQRRDRPHPCQGHRLTTAAPAAAPPQGHRHRRQWCHRSHPCQGHRHRRQRRHLRHRACPRGPICRKQTDGKPKKRCAAYIITRGRWTVFSGQRPARPFAASSMR